MKETMNDIIKRLKESPNLLTEEINSMINVNIKKLTPEAELPVYGSQGAACFDISYVGLGRMSVLPNFQVVMIPTGLAFEIPEGYVMMLYGRSGHGKRGIRLANCVGVIDSDYRGEVIVMMANDSLDPIDISPGDRIAQAMIVPVNQVSFNEVEELSETVRGEGGFGSTGK